MSQLVFSTETNAKTRRVNPDSVQNNDHSLTVQSKKIDPDSIPAIDADRATDQELVLYLNMRGVKVVSPTSGVYAMLHKSKHTALRATNFSTALKEANDQLNGN